MLIVADTSAVLALLDADSAAHVALRRLFTAPGQVWVLPAIILAEADYMIGRDLGKRTRDLWLEDLAAEAFRVGWHPPGDLVAAIALDRKYAALRLGLVDAMVMVAAERLRADAIATLDLRHFAAVEIAGHPKLLPRDAG